MISSIRWAYICGDSSVASSLYLLTMALFIFFESRPYQNLPSTGNIIIPMKPMENSSIRRKRLVFSNDEEDIVEIVGFVGDGIERNSWLVFGWFVFCSVR